MDSAVVAACSVLLVEDNEDLRETLADSLRADGYAVATACDGAEALEALRVGALPAVLVTDLMMPVMSGWELVSRLRRDDRFGALPIIVITAAGSASVPGSDALLRKPLRIGDLVGAIERLAPGSM
jgi:two-component system, chemotaxis family, chemotaxis protein CheY